MKEAKGTGVKKAHGKSIVCRSCNQEESLADMKGEGICWIECEGCRIWYLEIGGDNDDANDVEHGYLYIWWRKNPGKPWEEPPTHGKLLASFLTYPFWLSPKLKSTDIGISFVAPHINNLYFLMLCRKYGVYAVIKLLFAIKMGLGLFMFIMGPNHIWLLCLFIASNRVFTEGTCKLLNLVISDLVDEDFVLHQRHQAVSALMFGTAALMSKPGQTLAPLIGTWLLSQQIGHDIFQSGRDLGSIKLASSSLNSSVQQLQRNGFFNMLVYIPFFCGLIQLLIWSRFTLHGKRLQWIKSIRSGAEFSTV